MNEHTHMDFEDDGETQLGEAAAQYIVELSCDAGPAVAGDSLVFDMDHEPGAGDIVALRRAGRSGVEIGKLLTDLPKGLWKVLRAFGNLSLVDEDGPFMFRALSDDTVRSPKVSEFVGIDTCIEVKRASAANDDTPEPKARKPRKVRPRGPDGRFLKSGHVEPDGDAGQAVDKPRDKAPKWDPTERFMFDLEGKLYEIGALAEIVEALFIRVSETLQRVDPAKAAALDYAVCHLGHGIREVSMRYDEVRFPDHDDKAAA